MERTARYDLGHRSESTAFNKGATEMVRKPPTPAGDSSGAQESAHPRGGAGEWRIEDSANLIVGDEYLEAGIRAWKVDPLQVLGT